MVLWQLAYSHFNEKVRWALDFKGIPHERRDLLPGLHIPRVLWMTGQKQLPVLEIDGERICDSTAIIGLLEERFPATRPLYPADPVTRDRALKLEDFLDEQLGPHVRRAWFYELLQDPDYAAAAIAWTESPRTRRRFRRGFWLLAPVMKLDMRINATAAKHSWSKTEEALDRIASEIGGAGYLAGDDFSVADLTACSLMAPLLPDPVCPLAPGVEMPRKLAGFRERVAAHPALEWAIGVTERHR